MNLQELTRNQLSVSRKLIEFANKNRNADISSSFDNLLNWVNSLTDEELVLFKGAINNLADDRLLSK